MTSIFSGSSLLLVWASGLLGVIGLPYASVCGADEAEPFAAESRHMDGDVLAETSVLEPTPRKGELPPEIRRVQEALGGPAVDQFPSLRSARAAVMPARTPAAEQTPPRNVKEAVRALRNAAIQLDEAASRLEHLDLYRQADALRGQAQQLRLDARKLQRHAPPVEHAAPTPAAWPDGAMAPAMELAPSPPLPQGSIPHRIHP